jgi:hypothetical protein
MRNLRSKVAVLEVGTLETKKLLIGSGSGRKRANLGHGL